MQAQRDATIEEIDSVMKQAWEVFPLFRKLSLKERATFLRTIALEIESLGDALITCAMEESHLPQARLQGERGRTIFQLNSYADHCEQGDWLEVRIDKSLPDRNPPKPDIRKMQVALGPVVVLGASNFPFAFSTAGGDTASALAAGCPVVVKAHPAHPATSGMMAGAIEKAAEKCGLPKGVFAHVYGSGIEVGKALVTHPYTKALAFTGSYGGGKALFDWANARKEPIPVFAEMGSINPVFLLPEYLHNNTAAVAQTYAGSITLGVGQFCTNPGLIIGIEGDDLEQFIQELGTSIKAINPGTMLHKGIAAAYEEKRKTAITQEALTVVAEAGTAAAEGQGLPTVASATATAFLNNPVLHQEVFGPYSLVIRCKDQSEMLAVASHLEGQLTTTLMATEQDLQANGSLIDALTQICGRFIVNAVPTGVEVCLAMQHGGPFPATTDSRFTSVGADAVKRFIRPVSYQNWPDSLLPDALKNSNPLGLWRTVDNQLTQDPL